MSNHLDLMAQFNEKIHQLPPHLLIQVNDYINSLWPKWDDTDQETLVPVPKRQISDIFPRQLENIKPFSRKELYE